MRADLYFSARYGSRSKASNALKRGLVQRGGRALSPGDEVREGDCFLFLDDPGFASNGGYKLERGLDAFSFSAEGLVFADLGASTGGFCDCLLRSGARHVYCVDIGEHQLDPALAGDARVTVMDRTNARYLTREQFPEKIDAVVSDLSFISLSLVLPAIFGLLHDGGQAIVLFKPQFECGKSGIGKSGILPPGKHPPLLRDFFTLCRGIGMAPRNIVNAPLRPRKNVEYLVQLQKGGVPAPTDELLRRAADMK